MQSNQLAAGEGDALECSLEISEVHITWWVMIHTPWGLPWNMPFSNSIYVRG